MKSPHLGWRRVFGRPRNAGHRESLCVHFRRLALEPLEDRRLLSAYTVDSLDDTVAADDLITLREALEAANTNAQVGDAEPGSPTGADVISFDPALFAGGPATITLELGQLEIADDVDIQGPGAEWLTIDAQGNSRVVLVNGGVEAAISGLTITGASTSNYGGGICNLGTLTVADSTLSGNSAGSRGGGIYNYTSGTLTLMSSTVSGNSVTGTYASGGGIFNDTSGTVTVANSTISGNSADHDGGGIYNYRGTLTLVNSIVANNSADDLYGSLSVGSEHNLIGVDPMLSEFADLGNGQWGYYLLPGSPALDAGSNALAIGPDASPLLTDQAGAGRVGDGTVDMGAVEGVPDVLIPAVTYLVESFDRTIAADGVLTFWEALDAASGNYAVGDAAAGSPHGQDRIEFAAAAPDTLFLEGQPITLETWLAILASEANPITVDAQGNSRVFEILAGSRVLLQGLTVTGGRASYDGGGGIFNWGTLTLTNSIVSDNSGDGPGRGIHSRGILTVTNSAVSGNSAGGSSVAGGGIYNGGMLTVGHSAILANSGAKGGGIYNHYATAIIKDCTISGNTTTWYIGDGGGIYNFRGTVTVTNSTISRNSAKDDGGGIYNFQGTVTATNSTVSGNSARDLGGGICNTDYSTLSVGDVTLSDNSAGILGGGTWQAGKLGIEPGTRLDMEGDLFLTDRAEFAVKMGTLNPGLLATQGTATLGGTLVLEAVGPVGDLQAGEWGNKMLSIIQADGGLGGTTFVTEPATGEHLGYGVFYRGTSYSDTTVDVNLFQAGPGDANGDGLFNFADLIAIFSESGAYYGNTDVTDREWTGGDFNGDGSFTFADLVAAFSSLGAYYGGDAYAELPAANEVMAAAHDVVLARGLEQEPLAPSSSLSELAWLTEYERSAAQRRPDSSIAPAVDTLLATWP